MNVADLLGLVALLTKTVDTLRYAFAGHVNGFITQLVAWGIGVAGTFAVAQTQWASHISVGNGGTLAGQGALSLVAIGLAIASGGSVLNDLRSAVDTSNTAVIPPLLGPAFTVIRGAIDQAGTVQVPQQVHAFTDNALTQIEDTVTRVLGKRIGSVLGKPASPQPVIPPTPSHGGDNRATPVDPVAVLSGTSSAPAPPEADHGVTHPDFAVAADVPSPPAPPS